MTRVLFALLLCAVAARAQTMSPTKFAPMEKMRSLAGVWKGKVQQAPSKQVYDVELIWESVSGGQAVEERLTFVGYPSMVTMYYQEGDELMMTHFCSSNTQPRMRTRGWPKDLSEFKLEFVDATNILKANWMNVTYLKLEFPKPNMVRQTWKSHDPKESATVVEVYRVR